MTLPTGRIALKMLKKLVAFVEKGFTHKDTMIFFHLKEALRLMEAIYD